MEHVLSARMDRLHGWVLGLPWVVERPGVAEAPRLRWFALDCEPLGRRRLWLLTGALDGTASDDHVVHVVFPTPAGRDIVNTGLGRVVASVGDDHSLVSVRFDADEPVDDARLEHLLLLGYEASFA